MDESYIWRGALGRDQVAVVSQSEIVAVYPHRWAAVLTVDTLSSSEAATLLARLAARPGMRAGDAAVGEIARMCGYLPLAIGSLLRDHVCNRTWLIWGGSWSVRNTESRYSNGYTASIMTYLSLYSRCWLAVIVAAAAVPPREMN